MAASLTFPPAARLSLNANPPAYDLFTECPAPTPSPVTMIDDDLPSYGAERRTRPERCFWCEDLSQPCVPHADSYSLVGFIFFPIWAVGAALYFAPSDPLETARCKSSSKSSLVSSLRLSIHSREEGLAEMSVSDEMRDFWRAEERKFAYLCLQFFAAVSLSSTAN